MISKLKMKQWLIGAACLVLPPMLLFAIYIRGHLIEERDPYGMAKAALQLEFTSAKFVLVRNKPTEVLMHSNSSKPLDTYMARHGWHPVDPIQMGALFYFGKGKEKMTIDSRPFTFRYRFYELQKTP